MQLLLIFTVVLTYSLSYGQRFLCPAKEAIGSCTCKVNPGSLLSILCEGISSVDQLRKSVIGMKGYKFAIFALERSSLGRLPSDIFSGIDIESLSIEFTNLTALGDGVNKPAFLGLENSLQYLEIRDSFRNENLPLSSFQISHLKKLVSVQLEGNFIPVVGNDWFESGPYNMKEVHIIDSETDLIGSHAFAYLENIKKVSLTGGFLSSLLRTMFPKPANTLEYLDLSNNHLSSLPNDIFRWMPSLVEVLLPANAFATIDEVVWSPVWNQLTRIFIYANPMNCDKNIRWIYKYRLPEVFIGVCRDPENLRGKELRELTDNDFVKENSTAQYSEIY